MANTPDPFFDCKSIMTLPLGVLLNALLVKASDGSVGFRTQVITSAANTVTDMVDCNNNGLQDPENAFRQAIGIDTEGKPALNLIKVN